MACQGYFEIFKYYSTQASEVFINIYQIHQNKHVHEYKKILALNQSDISLIRDI